MKFYLSSFKFGKDKDQLKILAPKGRIAIIPNALDFREVDDERTIRSLENKIERLEQLDYRPKLLILRIILGEKKTCVKL